VDVPPDRFEALVAEALDAIPDDLARLMDNVVVVIDDQSLGVGLLGRYEGIPLTERGSYGDLVLPDRITVFRHAICSMCDSEAEVTHQVMVTVIHEVAHHFGIDDDRLNELGWG
jgi:predicted Zn-dependent protease with MMP-like domain